MISAASRTTENNRSDGKKLKNQSLKEPLLVGMAMDEIYDSDCESLPSFQDGNERIMSESNSQLSSRDASKAAFIDRDSLLHETTKLLSNRVYANNAPKIFLETITAQTAVSVIALTYIFFIVGFALDFSTTYQSFSSSNVKIGAQSCSSQNLSHQLSSNGYWGCSSSRDTWNSTIAQLTNVISISLEVQQYNLTSIFTGNNSQVHNFNLQYDISIWGCYQTGGCSSTFQSFDQYDGSVSHWQQVVQLQNQNILISLPNNLDSYSSSQSPYTVTLLTNTFQNQEAIPTNGLVKSYFVFVQYYNDPLLYTATPQSAPFITYKFNVVSRPTAEITNGFTVALMFLTLVVLCVYIYILYDQNKQHKVKILSEQKWVVVYFVLLIMFQNPVYCVIVWYQLPSAVATYSSYVMDYFAQSGLFVLWLLFADSLNRKNASPWRFYLPKILFGLAIFTCGVVILTYQFPGLLSASLEGSQRSPVEAVVNWSQSAQQKFIAFSFLYLILLWLWTFLWFFRLFMNNRRLKQLPYMSTRYIQLSFRFLLLQATLVTLYYVFQYASVVYFITAGSKGSATSSDNLADNINTLFREQTELFGKVLFLTVYALILAFLFLPANFMNAHSDGLLSTLASTYAISESEYHGLVLSRRRAVYTMRRKLLNQVTLMNQLIRNIKPDVFCLELALFLRSLSFQAYYDPPQLATASGYEGEMDLQKIGFTLVKFHYSREHEVFCFIARQDSTRRLVVCFRGTASKKQMEDNLNYTQRHVDFEKLDTTTLDQLDGLKISENDSKRSEDAIESVSDDEDELVGDAGEWAGINSVSEESSIVKTAAMLQRLSHAARTGGGGGGGLRSRESSFQDESPHQEEEAGGRESVIERAGKVEVGIKRGLSRLLEMFYGAVGYTISGTTGLMVTAASNTPGLKEIVLTKVHSGFWDAYLEVRSFIHANLRMELVREPTAVFFTGHSLGGALATFAALDVSLHTIPRVNSYLKHRMWKAMLASPQTGIVEDRRTPGRSRGLSRLQPSPDLEAQHPSASASASARRAVSTSPMHAADHHHLLRGPAAAQKFVKKCKVFMYNFGSPRVGNRNFVQLYNRIVPCSYRVVVDGDIVTGLPPSKYKHVGTQILIDSIGAGTIIIDPSFVEKWLRTTMKSSVAVHSLLVYRKGLLGIKLAAEFLGNSANDVSKAHLDPLRLVLTTDTDFAKQVDSVMDENMSITGRKAASNLDASASEDLRAAATPLHSDGPGPKLATSRSFRSGEAAAEVMADDMSPLAIAERDEQLRLLKLQQGESRSYLSEERDAKHYAQDVANMKSVLTQIHSFHGSLGPIEWLRKKSKGIGKFQQRMTSKSFAHPKKPMGPPAGQEDLPCQPVSAHRDDPKRKVAEVESSVVADEGVPDLSSDFEYKLTNCESPNTSINIMSHDSVLSDDGEH